MSERERERIEAGREGSEEKEGGREREGKGERARVCRGGYLVHL